MSLSEAFLRILRVADPGAIVPSLYVLQGEPGVIQDSRIDVQHGAVGTQDMDEGGNGIDDLTKVTLARPQSIFGLFAIINIGAGAVPSHDLAGLVAEGLGANKEPMINAIMSAKSRLNLIGFS